MKVLYEKFLENCTDPIASVRQGGACSLGYLVKANKEFLDPTIKEGIDSGSLVKWGASSECWSSLYTGGIWTKYPSGRRVRLYRIIIVPLMHWVNKFIPLKSLFVTVSKI